MVKVLRNDARLLEACVTCNNVEEDHALSLYVVRMNNLDENRNREFQPCCNLFRNRALDFFFYFQRQSF